MNEWETENISVCSPHAFAFRLFFSAAAALPSFSCVRISTLSLDSVLSCFQWIFNSRRLLWILFKSLTIWRCWKIPICKKCWVLSSCNNESSFGLCWFLVNNSTMTLIIHYSTMRTIFGGFLGESFLIILDASSPHHCGKYTKRHMVSSFSRAMCSEIHSIILSTFFLVVF